MGGTEEEVKREEKEEEKHKEKTETEEKPKKEKKKEKEKEEKKKKNPEDKKDPSKLRAKLEKIEVKIRDLLAKKEDILKLIEVAEKNPQPNEVPPAKQE